MTTAVKQTLNFRAVKEEGKPDQPAPKPLVVEMQMLALDDVVRLLSSGDEKVQQSIVDDLNAVVYKHYRSLVDTIGIEKVRADGGIDPAQYSYEAIANLPPASKSMFDDETWTAFKEDYVRVMAAQPGVDEKRAKVGAEILSTRLTRVKGNIDALQQFKERINVWYSHSEQKEEMQKVYQYLLQRAEDFIRANQPETLLATF